jgi:DNA-binding transcriptional LysR family regulator
LNFSRAAEELLLTQPAVTQQVKALEDELGVPLFDRSGGRITLTAGGKVLLPLADQMKEISDQAFAAVAEASGEQAGELAVGASQTIAQYLCQTSLRVLSRPIHGFGLSPAAVTLKRCWMTS